MRGRAEAAEPLRLWRCRRRRANQTSHGRRGSTSARARRRSRDAVARPRDRRDREGDGWEEPVPSRSGPLPTLPSQSPLPLRSRERESRGPRADRSQSSPKRRSRFGWGGAEGAAQTKPATDHPQKRRAGGRRAPACAPPFVRDAVARSAPGAAAIAKATDGRSSTSASDTTFAVPHPCPPRSRGRGSARGGPRADRVREGRARLLAGAEPIRLWRCRRRKPNQPRTTPEAAGAGSTSARVRAAVRARCGSEERPRDRRRSTRRRMGGADPPSERAARPHRSGPTTDTASQSSPQPSPLARERESLVSTRRPPSNLELVPRRHAHPSAASTPA